MKNNVTVLVIVLLALVAAYVLFTGTVPLETLAMWALLAGIIVVVVLLIVRLVQRTP